MNVLIYTPRFGHISETFITDQSIGVGAHIKTLICNKAENIEKINPPFPVIEVADVPEGYTDRFFSFLKRKKRGIEKYSLPNSSVSKIIRILQKEKIDLIHCHYGPSGLAILDIAKYHNIPLLVSFHGFDASFLLRDEEYKMRLPVLFKYAYCIVVSLEMEKVLKNLGMELEKYNLIPYGVKLESIQSSKYSHSKKERTLSILHSGRLTEKKGVKDLLKVIKDLRAQTKISFQFKIVGGGDDLTVLKNFVKENLMEDYVSFLGPMPHMEVLQNMLESDIFVLNSRIADSGDSEGLPVSILEAMATGLPVVSTIHAGIPEAITHDYNGLLGPERDNEKLKENILTLLENPEKRKFLGLNAKKTIEQSFSHHKNIERIVHFYQEITSQR